MSAHTTRTTSLPRTRSFLTKFLSTLPSSHSHLQLNTTSTEPANLTISQKPTFLALHALFPSLLLPALDLLDRRLITRFTLSDKSIYNETEDAGELDAGRVRSGTEDESQRQRVVYYVKSNSQISRSSRYGKHGEAPEVNYEVRTQAWNCSCAAFAFAAFNTSAALAPVYRKYESYEGYENLAEDADDAEMLDAPEKDENFDNGVRGQWRWGGLTLLEEAPLCKHLLACVLSERWSVAGTMIEETKAEKEEMAGWAAGWGG
ncbi:hypothetical protein P7C71_g156, partial [Lecanoromycetidae sp. Uapishka_2]